MTYMTVLLTKALRNHFLSDQLARIGLIPTLSALFDTIDWLKPPPAIPPHERVHGMLIYHC